MKRPALLLVLCAAACSSYEVAVDVQIAPVEVASVASGVYAADTPALQGASRLPFRQATVDVRPEHGGGSHTWHVKQTYTQDEKLRWRGTLGAGRPPTSVVVEIGAPGRKPVEARFPCSEEGARLDLVGVLERTP